MTAVPVELHRYLAGRAATWELLHAYRHQGLAAVQLPAWPAGCDEAAYNAHAAKLLSGTLLDRKLIRTSQHPSGIDACDVLAPSGILVHVKNLDGSAAASHLIGQALASADALLYDEEARRKLGERVREAGGDPAHVPSPVHSVVLGIARTGHPCPRGRPASRTWSASLRRADHMTGGARLGGRRYSHRAWVGLRQIFRYSRSSRPQEPPRVGRRPQ